jgi:hypothetical protein
MHIWSRSQLDYSPEFTAMSNMVKRVRNGVADVTVIIDLKCIL